MAPPVSAPPKAAPVNATNDDEAFDPLGAFLQDLDVDDPAPPASAAAPKNETPFSADLDPLGTGEESGASVMFDDDDASKSDGDDDDLDDFDLDIFDDPAFDELMDSGNPLDLAEPELEVDPPVAVKAQSPAPPPRSEERPAPVSKPKAPQPPPQTQARRPEPSKPQTPPANNPRSDARPQESTKQFAAPPPPKQQPPQDRPAPTPMRPKMGGQPMQMVQKQARPPEPQNRPKQTPPPAPPAQGRPAERRDQPRGKDHEPRPKQDPQAGGRADSMRQTRDAQRPVAEPQSRDESRAPAASQPQASAGGPRLGKMKPGKLFGWLVSYENPDGRAIELRAGRFFVTGTNIRDTDLILEDQSISTPHALMSITERGLLLQDLMSERGTFVRSQDEAQYRREDGIIEVQHGDWIRFGDVEFLVTIVPG
jgi:hypothetical protein